MLFRYEKKSDKESRNKLAPIALEPYLVKYVDDEEKTAFIVNDDKTVENVSLSRIMLSPKRLCSAELQSIFQPTVFNLTIANYSAAEAVNLNHILPKDYVNANETTIDETSAHEDQSMDEIRVKTDEL